MKHIWKPQKFLYNTMAERFFPGKKRFQREAGIKQTPLVWADL